VTRQESVGVTVLLCLMITLCSYMAATATGRMPIKPIYHSAFTTYMFTEARINDKSHVACTITAAQLAMHCKLVHLYYSTH
jgi:hypothetical protein